MAAAGSLFSCFVIGRPPVVVVRARRVEPGGGAGARGGEALAAAGSVLPPGSSIAVAIGPGSATHF